VEIDVKDAGLSVYEDEYTVSIRKCFVAGFFFNVAKKSRNQKGVYVTVKNSHEVMVHPSSILAKSEAEFVLYHELVFTTKEYMRNIIEIDGSWLIEIAPHFYKKEDLEDPSNKKNKKKMPLQ
jgi:pre-mRNA-splicing factor ATP-dependent RNA helicase DHX16